MDKTFSYSLEINFIEVPMTIDKNLTAAIDWRGGRSSLLVSMTFSVYALAYALVVGGTAKMSAFSFALWCASFFAPLIYGGTIALCAAARCLSRRGMCGSVGQ
jgi:hypothetical protein